MGRLYPSTTGRAWRKTAPTGSSVRRSSRTIPSTNEAPERLLPSRGQDLETTPPHTDGGIFLSCHLPALMAAFEGCLWSPSWAKLVEPAGQQPEAPPPGIVVLRSDCKGPWGAPQPRKGHLDCQHQAQGTDSRGLGRKPFHCPAGAILLYSKALPPG